MNSLPTLVTLISLIAAPALADSPDDRRLIQTDVYQKQWMNQEQIRQLIKTNHARGVCGGFMDITENPNDAPVRVMSLRTFDAPDQQEEVLRLLPELSADRIEDTVKKLSDYPNRYYKSNSGVEAAEWIHAQFTEMSAHRTDVKVDYFQHSFPQKSVIATLEGNGPLSDERIIIGAHEDSIAGFFNPSGKAPGADDDASGVATVLEVFRVLMDANFRPHRTIQFMTYAGEEAGLLGSQDIAKQYQQEGVNVVAVLQLDMTMFAGSGEQITIISDHVDRELTNFLEMIIDEYVKIPWKEDTCGYACSDHASWKKYGFASAFPFEAAFNNYNRNIHTARDTLVHLDANLAYTLPKLRWPLW